MDTSSSTTIVVPPRFNIAVFLNPSVSLVVVAPPGVTADPGVLTRPGVTGLFTHEERDWPDAAGCRAANTYLAAGHPIVLQFGDQPSAEACHARLTTGAAA